MENTNGVNKKKMRKLLYIYIAIILVLVFSSRTIYNFSLPRVTVAMSQSGFITTELEVRSVVEFSETFDVFARSSGWIDEIFISRGDFIYIDGLIARYEPLSDTNEQATAGLRTNIERTEHQLMRLNIQREDIQSNIRALSATSPNDMIQLEWAVDDALANIESRQTELSQVQGEILQAEQMVHQTAWLFGYIEANTEAEREWNRRITELNNARSALQQLELRGNNFDDFNYQQAILETSIALERRIQDLQNAESTLEEARRSEAGTFDARIYQNTINAAQAARQRNQIAYDAAHQQLNMAWHRLQLLQHMGVEADWAEVAAAHAAVNDAQMQVESARITLNESDTLLSQANDNLQRSRNAFNAQDREQRSQLIENAEALVLQAENAVADATRANEHAIAIMDRAESAATVLWQAEILEAQNRVDTALLALDESAWGASQNLRQTESSLRPAESNLADAYQALERAERNLELAQRATTTQMDDTRRALENELRDIDLEIERTMIDLRADQSSLTSMDIPNTANITSNRQGIITAMDKREGQFISQGERIATIGIHNNRFIVEFSAPISEAGFIDIGDEANIYRGASNIGIRAFVYDITPIGDNLNVTLISETDQFSGGEFVRVRFRNQTGLHHMVVPNEAIFVGAMGQHYVWVVQSRQGALGREYVSVRRSVRIIDSDDFNTAIDMGFAMADMPVITSYSRELSVNGRVSRME